MRGKGLVLSLWTAVASVVVLVGLVAAGPAVARTSAAAQGSLDPSFGTAGIVTTDIAQVDSPSNGGGVALQADGRIVVVGAAGASLSTASFEVVRYMPEGSLDATFGSGGKVTVDPGVFGYAFGLAVQADGKIVAVGQNNAGALVVRLNADGSLDSGFGSAGEVTTQFGGSAGASASGVAIQTNGKLVVAGTAGGNDFGVARFNANGSLDTTFSSDGVTTTDFGASDFIWSVALQSNGKIVAGGDTGDFSTIDDFAIARYNTDGSLDTSFSSDGKLTTDFGGLEFIQHLALQADSKVVAVGGSSTSGGVLARYNTNGSLDSSFSSDGKVTGLGSLLNAIAVQPDQKIVTAGDIAVSGTSDFAVHRLGVDGSLDATFGSAGEVTTDVSPRDHGLGVLVRPDGRLVVTGRTGTGPLSTGPTDFTVLRYQASFASGLLRVTSSPGVPAQILVDGVLRDSWGLAWLKLGPGSHTVSFTHVEGWTEPAPQTVTVTAGATTVVTGTFTQRGSLRVLTSPAVPGTVSVDGTPRDDWGIWTDIGTGSHQVCFGKVQGFNPPACQAAVVSAGLLTTVTGTYTVNAAAPGATGVGLLRVTTSPAVPAQILVDGVLRDSWGLAWVKLAPGSHTVSFTHVEGWTEPAPQTVTITAGATAVVTGTFSQRGSLRVLTSPAGAGTVSVDGTPRNDWGIWTDLPAGPHEVCFGDVGALTTPPCQTATVTAGSLTTVTGTYT